MKKILLILLVILLTSPLAADSEGLGNPGNCPVKGDFGLNINIPGMNPATIESIVGIFQGFSIGFTWHIADTFFIRSAFMFTKYKFEDTATSERTYIGAQTDFLFAVKKKNNLMVYLGPSLQFLTDNNGDNDGNGHDVMCAQLKLGVQYNFSKTFGIYGDFGYGMISDNDKNSSSNDDTTTYLGFFGAFAGIVIYL